MRKGLERNEAFFNNANSGQEKNQGVKNVQRRARQSGVIDLSRAGLQELSGSTFDLEDLDEDEKFWEAIPVTKVDISQVPSGLLGYAMPPKANDLRIPSFVSLLWIERAS